MRKIKRCSLLLFTLSVLFLQTLHAASVEISHEASLSILEKSEIYFDEKCRDTKEIMQEARFMPYGSSYINASITRDVIWIKFTLRNSTQAAQKRVLVLSSPLLEHITLYKEGESEKSQTKGHAHITSSHKTLFYYFDLTIAPKSSKTYYLKVYSDYNPIDFSVTLEDREHFHASDLYQQMTTILLSGMILALMIYSFLLFIFIKDKSYFFYALYLFALLYQQITYLGLTQIYFPLWFVLFDMKIPIVKVTLLIATSALFAMYFLKIKWDRRLYQIYIFFIFATLLEMIFLSSRNIWSMYIVIATGTLFIVFNLFAALKTYLHGFKEARLFIVGFGIVFVSYIMIITDALGLTSIMQHFQNILMWATAAEALILSLAFADRYRILQQAKTKSDAKLLEESQKREKIITHEVHKKTEALEQALTNKDTLLQEVHHRVKNNLQIILSMIRLQGNQTDDPDIKETFRGLQNRINAIAKTYNMLIERDDLAQVNMDGYIGALLSDMQCSLSESFSSGAEDVKIMTDIDALLPLRQAVYLGLIINELITNSYKHAFDKEKTGSIQITLKQEESDYFLLHYGDSGKGFDASEPKRSLGLKLIESLVVHQLEGEFLLSASPHTHYVIRFKL